MSRSTGLHSLQVLCDCTSSLLTDCTIPMRSILNSSPKFSPTVMQDDAIANAPSVLHLAVPSVQYKARSYKMRSLPSLLFRYLSGAISIDALLLQLRDSSQSLVTRRARSTTSLPSSLLLIVLPAHLSLFPQIPQSPSQISATVTALPN